MEYKMGTAPAEWKPAPRVCRCCLSEGCYKDISTEYYWLGEKEMYSQMLKECFDLTISLSEAAGNSRLICEVCITRLRDASNFKKQVINSEKRFAEHLRSGASLSVAEVQETPVLVDIKVEGVKDEAAISDDDPDPVDDDIGDPDYDESDDLPLKFEVQKKESMTELSFGDEIPALNTSETTIRKVSSRTKEKSALKKLKMNKKELTIKPVKASTSKKKDKEAKVKLKATKPGAKKAPVQRDRERAFKINAVTIIRHSTCVPFISMRNSFRCFYCSESFADFPPLRDHTQNHTSDIESTVALVRRHTLKFEISIIRCKICEDFFENIPDLQNHLRDSHNKKFYDSPDSFLMFKLSKVNDLFACYMCPQTFHNFHNLNMHLNVHFHDHACKECGVGFASAQRLRMHEYQVHEHIGTFLCHLCGKEFSSQSKRKVHIQRVHEGKAALKCPKCDERFKDYDDKMKHMIRVHGVNPLRFECECGKIFTTKRLLSSHIRLVHPKHEGEGDHCCQYCSKRFQQMFKLLRHERVHFKPTVKKEMDTNQECETCKKMFKTTKLFKQHIRRSHRTNERTFFCAVCGKGFFRKHNLNKHVKLKHPLFCTNDFQK